MAARRVTPSGEVTAIPRGMLLQIRIPLLMSVVLTAVVGVALVVIYTTLNRAALATAGERLSRGTRQLATLVSAGLVTQQSRFVAVGHDTAVRRALVAGGVGNAPGAAARHAQERVMTALQQLVQATDSGMPVELWTTDGRRVAFVGNDLRSAMTVDPERGELEEPLASLDDALLAHGDSLLMTPMYPENGRVHLWLVLPIRERAQTLGFIAQQRRIMLGPAAQRSLRELSGDSVSLYWRNADGRFWAWGNGQQFRGLRSVDLTAGTARDSAGEKLLFHEERLGASPLFAGMIVSVPSVIARSDRSFRRIFLLSIALTLAGIAAAWMIGRSVVRPLGAITRASGRLALGDYRARVPTKGDYEVRRLAETFNHMAEELGASRVALEQQTREARAANNAKSEFLAKMSHELRTPLNAIGGYVDLLDMGIRGPLTDVQRRDLQRIKASQQHLLGLISSVLDLSRIEARRVSFALADIGVLSLIEGIDALVAPQAAAKPVALVHTPCSPLLAVTADREKLRQILLNLLSNAIRHTPSGGTVHLSAEDRGARVAIVVQDTGPGIPPGKREVIFEPFVQLDRSLTQSREGLGLGLAISRDLARGMSGDIIAEDAHGAGARFVLTLPRGNSDSAIHLRASDEVPVRT